MTAAFLGLEAALYAAFMTLDLTGGSGDPVKYASIAVCLAFSVLFACRGGSRLMAAAMALSLAACGGGKTETPSDSNTPADNTSAEPTKLSLILRGGTYADVIKECLPAFEAEHNVVCEVQELSEGDLYSGIALDAINDKGSYDLCMVDGSWMAEFTENGVLANLTELGYSLDEDVIPATTTICKVGEDIYLAPYYGNVTVMMYNK